MLFSTPVEELVEQPVKEPVTKINRTELLTEELNNQIEIIIATGTVSFQQLITDEKWLPFSDKSLEVYMKYNYHITYKLDQCEITMIGDRHYISLVNRFTYNEPSLIEEAFTVDKKAFSGNFSEDTYSDILKTSRKSVLEKVKQQPTQSYRMSVERNLNALAKKFGIENIKYIWKAE